MKIHPLIVVAVLVAFSNGTLCAWRVTLRLQLEKSKPGSFIDPQMNLSSNDWPYKWSIEIFSGLDLVGWLGMPSTLVDTFIE